MDEKMYSEKIVIGMLEVAKDFGHGQGFQEGYVHGRQGFLSANEESGISKVVSEILKELRKKVPAEIRSKLILPKETPINDSEKEVPVYYD